MRIIEVHISGSVASVDVEMGEGGGVLRVDNVPVCCIEGFGLGGPDDPGEPYSEGVWVPEAGIFARFLHRVRMLLK